MSGDGPGVGMGGKERLLRDFEQVLKARIVEVRDVHKDTAPFHFGDDGAAER